MEEKNKTNKTILLSGGGTGGSVMPLLAVAEELIKEEIESGNWKLKLVFVGTEHGPEREMVENFRAGDEAEGGRIKFIPLSGGKWRRYFSLANFLDIFKIIAAFFRSFKILKNEKPDIIISAGSFVSVPLVWVAAFKKIPILIHQQDVRPGLANKLMAPFARVVTVTFEKSLLDYGPKAVWTGNPTNEQAKYQERAEEIKNKYELDRSRPLVLFMGGGTGSTAINKLVYQSVEELIKFCQIIHLTGKGKGPDQEIDSNQAEHFNNYRSMEFLSNEEVLTLMSVADLVISRCGLGVLTELAALGRSVILIPMPGSHQEDNAAVFARADAAIVLKQKDLTPEKLTAEIKRVLSDAALKEKLKNNIGKIIKRGAAESIAGIVWEMIK